MHENITTLTNSVENDHKLWCNYRDAFITVFNARNNRQNIAFGNHLGEEFSQKSKLTLPELEKLIAKYQICYNTSDREIFATKIQKYQNMINNQDYIDDTSADWQYRQELEAHMANFVWPDANELVIRQQEEAELMALLGQ